MKGKIFLVLSILGLIVGSFILAKAVGNPAPFNLRGIFHLENGWSGDGGTTVVGGGYPGKTIFSSGGGQIYNDGTLSGSFWLGNVGWATFSHDVSSLAPRINCPADIYENAAQLCYVTGAVWSQNAGWILLSKESIGTSSGVYFDPNTGNMAGWGWSQTLGWVPFWTGITGASGMVTPTVGVTPPALSGVPINFVGRIAIIGNIAGSRIFTVTNSGVVNQDVGDTYTSIHHGDVLDMIRKNLAVMSRNISDTELANIVSNHEYIIKKDGTDYVIDGGWNAINPNPTGSQKRTVVVIGADIVLNKNFINASQWEDKNIALIALKGTNGSGGNIIITDKVKRVYAYLYAEGTIFSGEKDTWGVIQNYTDGSIWNIPKNQLYIRGIVVSKNTIGGAQQKPDPICPVVIGNCTETIAYKYDWNYFRVYDPEEKATQYSLPLERQGIPNLDIIPMIIEYDPNIMTNPPPGFREIR